jgi:DNA cross-link repair 1A protein
MKIPGTTIEVDDYRPRDASLHVLTHYHADHRKGLELADSRPMLCSPETAILLRELHQVPARAIREIAPGESRELERGVQVRAFDANHCPGALMLRFDVRGRRILHTGDFRYCVAHDAESELFDSIDTLLVDTTYGGVELGAVAEQELPTQEAAIERVLELIASHPTSKVKLGVYRIGKNRIVRAIKDRLGLRVALSKDYHRVYDLLGMGECVTRDRAATRIHGYGMRWFTEVANPVFDGSIAILPTAWTDGKPRHERVHCVPYSEHCSASELRRFIAKVNAREVVRTNDFF